MLKTLENGVWVDRSPNVGETYREYRLVGTNSEHYIEGRWFEPIVEVEDRRITKLAFTNRFTFEEEVAIEMAAETDAAVRVILRKVNNAVYIDLDSPQVLATLGILVDKQLLTAERSSEIQGAPVEDNERPNS